MKVSHVVVSRFFARSRKMPTKHHNAGYYCAVPCCSTHSTNGDLHFHRFPASEQRRKEWCIAIRSDRGANFKVTTNTRVCSAHFLPSDYRRTLYGVRLRRLCRLSLRGRNELVRSAAFFVDESLRLPTKCRAVAVALSKTSDPQQW